MSHWVRDSTGRHTRRSISVPHSLVFVAAVLGGIVSGPLPRGACQDSSDPPRVQLPKHWVEKHGARTSYDGCGFLGFSDLLPDAPNANPHIPTGIGFYGYQDVEEKLTLRELDRFDGLLSLAVFDGKRLAPEAWTHIATMKNLQALVVTNSSLDDSSLKSLLPLRELVILDVSMSDITDESIDELASFPNLRALNISGTKMTLRGAEKLRARLPVSSGVALDRWIYGERMDPHWGREIKWTETENVADEESE